MTLIFIGAQSLGAYFGITTNIWTWLCFQFVGSEDVGGWIGSMYLNMLVLSLDHMEFCS